MIPMSGITNWEEAVMGARGYVVVLTGNGKGKTTSALGMAMRAVGQGMRVAMLQFLKGTWKYGELETARRLEPDFVLRPLGEGFIHVDAENPDPRDVACAGRAWEQCKEALFSGDYGMVIFDELNRPGRPSGHRGTGGPRYRDDRDQAPL
jgi:cob(I)alamin adenosyltransferase